MHEAWNCYLEKSAMTKIPQFIFDPENIRLANYFASKHGNGNTT